MNKEELIEKFNKLVNTLEDNLHTRLEAEKNLESINSELKYIELTKLKEITNLTDSEGKKVYTNETSRTTAVNEELRNNSGYIELKNKAKEQEEIINVAKINYEIIKLKLKGIELEVSLNKMDDELLQTTLKYLRGDV